jgi:hypothetical protein
MKIQYELNKNPELMTVICNIQAMNQRINPNYKWDKDFKRLEKMTGKELRKEQNELVPLYNATFKHCKI